MKPTALSPEAFDDMDAILDDLRTRYDETPQWEFCEGFMAALICNRRVISPEEYFSVLLATDEGDNADSGEQPEGSFVDAAQRERFMALWTQRWSEVQTALNTAVESLEDEAAYHPEVMDVRGAVAALSDAERAEMGDEALPSFGQVWALGFMFVVETWPDDWTAPRDKEGAKWLDVSLQALVALTEDDNDEPTISIFSEQDPPSVSVARFNAFADAIWAVYDLRELWRTLGPKVETIRKTASLGRNDLCHCGSGKKFKKCHGAT
jgi:uncharacterized protein